MVSAARALIVDDDADMRELVRLVLEVEGGLHCDEAGDAFHALEAWHADHHDVLIVDHRMPGITGLELAEAILNDDPNQIVILFTAYLDNDAVDRAHQVGVCAVLGKDEVRRLPRVIDEALAS